jgi:hypothetical protein
MSRRLFGPLSQLLVQTKSLWEEVGNSPCQRRCWSDESDTRLGITGLWTYDLRRTLATSMSNELGYDDSTIRAILNHNDTSALGHYRFKSFDSLIKPGCVR